MTLKEMVVRALVDFEADIAAEFNAGRIRAPVHLSGGNESQLYDYFDSNFRAGDWVCTTWRSHYHCLFAGVPPHKLKAAIMEGRSITLCFPEFNVISSAIVGGILPIAVGIAMDNLRQRRVHDEMDRPQWVHCFVGDMAECIGAYHDAKMMAATYGLPITFIVEDNGKSVMTPTGEVICNNHLVNEVRYKYELPWPHAGAGVRVQF